MSQFINRTVDNLRGGPLGPVVRAVEAHPRLAAWLVLALGMVILLVVEARDVGLLTGQWVALIAATVLVAGVCVWIITWEDAEEVAAENTAEAASEDTDEAE